MLEKEKKHSTNTRLKIEENTRLESKNAPLQSQHTRLKSKNTQLEKKYTVRSKKARLKKNIYIDC